VQKNKHLPIVFSGSQLEAKWTKKILLETGIEENRLLIDYESTTTAENATKSFALIKPNTRDPWVLVTSAFHISRAYKSFIYAGWNVIPHPTTITRLLNGH
jgi:uncharacterized SAM-binding protein YcdF (DUF218 family)